MMMVWSIILSASADTIQNVAYKFVKTGKQLNLNLEHSNEPVTGFVAESWIIRDKDNDKSKAVGLDMDLPVGTWCVLGSGRKMWGSGRN